MTSLIHPPSWLQASNDAPVRPEGAVTKLRNFDWALVVPVVVLSLFGLAAIYSATRASSVGDTFVIKQSAFVLGGIVLMAIVSFIDYREWRNFLGLLCLATIVVLILVLTPLGTEVKGTQGWFRIGGVSIQPAEFAKLTVIVTLAAVFTGRFGSVEAPRIAGALGFLGVITALVLLQGETGSVFIYCFIAMGVFLVAGVPMRVLVLLILSGIAAFALAFTTGVLEPYQKDRLTAFIDEDADLRRAGYNQRQSVTAIGSGGLTGQGYLEGPQTQLGFLPEQETDFIFASIGEETGFVGNSIVVALYAAILMRVFRSAQLARDGFGGLLSVGVFTYLAIQSFQNMGMNLRLTPITGVPLPFVSYGGSSIITAFLAIGLVQSVAIHRHRGTPV